MNSPARPAATSSDSGGGDALLGPPIILLADEIAPLSWTAVGLIREVGRKLSLPPLVTCSALALYHRFTAAAAAAEFDSSLIVMAVVYLATKAEECPRDLRDVITVGHSCIHRDEPTLRVGKMYRELRESVIACELLVLRGVGFDLGGVAAHPHRHLLHFATLLEQHQVDRREDAGAAASSSDIPTDDALRGAVNTAWALCNDAYITRLPVLTPPAHLAVVALWLAAEAIGIASVLGMEAAAGSYCPELSMIMVENISRNLRACLTAEAKNNTIP
jgi:hypothetical protein